MPRCDDHNPASVAGFGRSATGCHTRSRNKAYTPVALRHNIVSVVLPPRARSSPPREVVTRTARVAGRSWYVLARHAAETTAEMASPVPPGWDVGASP